MECVGRGDLWSHRDDLDGLVETSAAVAVGGGYRLNPRLRLLAIQEGILAETPRRLGTIGRGICSLIWGQIGA